MSTKALNPRTKSWQQILDLMQAEGWPVPPRIASLLDRIAHVDEVLDELPAVEQRKTDTELGRLLVESSDPVATMLAEDDAEARRDALRRARETLANYSRHVSTSALPRLIRDTAEELCAIAAEQAELVMADARPHVEVLRRFAGNGYRHAEVMASGTPEELAAAQAVEVMERRFILALNVWTLAARTALSRAGGRVFDARPDLSGGVAWTNPREASREELAMPEETRLVVAAAHPAGFALPRSFAELKRRQDEADRARLKYRSDAPDELSVDPSTLSDELAA